VLASVNHVFNAVFVRGDIVGDTLFYGRGAGKDATASAVLSDLADAALDLKFGTKTGCRPLCRTKQNGAVLPIDEVVSRYFVRPERGGCARARWPRSRHPGRCADRHFLGHPTGRTRGESVPLILMLHEAPNGA
jgi:homoserine dehydrogenase